MSEPIFITGMDYTVISKAPDDEVRARLATAGVILTRAETGSTDSPSRKDLAMDMPDPTVPLQAGAFYLCPLTTCPRGRGPHPFISKEKAVRHIRGEHTLEQVWTAWVDRNVELPPSWNEWLALHS